MGIVEKTFDKLNNRLNEKYNIRFLDEDIPRSRNTNNKRLALASVALFGAELKMKQVEKIRKGMLKSINDLNTTKTEKIADKVDSIVRTQDKIIGKTAEALNYLGKVNSSDNDNDKYQIGSSSIIIRPWLNWRSIKFRGQGFVKGVANFFRKVPVPISVVPDTISSFVPSIENPVLLAMQALRVPIPVVEAAVVAGYAVREKGKIKKEAIYGTGENSNTRRIGEVVQYDEGSGQLKVNKSIIDSLASDKIAGTVLNGNNDNNYKTIDVSESVIDENKIDDEKTENYLDTMGEEKQPQIENEKTEEKEESIVTPITPEPEINVDIINSADDLMKDFDREEAMNKIATYAVNNEPIEKDAPEEVMPEETKTEENIIEEKDDNKTIAADEKIMVLIQKLNDQIESFNEIMTSMKKEIDELKEENERLKEKNIEEDIEEEGKHFYQGKHFMDENKEVNNAENFIHTKVIPKMISNTNIEDGTPIYHADGSITIKTTKPTPDKSHWRLQNNDYASSGQSYGAMQRTM